MTSSDDDRFGRFADLEADLRALGEALEVPAPPPADVARAVRTRLAEPVVRVRRAPRRLTALVAVFLVALIAVTPQGRAAVVTMLRFAGVEISVGGPGPLPTGVPRPLPDERRVTLDEARQAARFPIAMPSALGDPSDIRIADGGRVVTLLWPGLRLDEFDGTLEVVFRKDLGEPWPLQVSGVNGWWIRQPHAVSYVPRHGGAPREERVAGPTLIWQRDTGDVNVGMRLECEDYQEALRIARSVR